MAVEPRRKMEKKNVVAQPSGDATERHDDRTIAAPATYPGGDGFSNAGDESTFVGKVAPSMESPGLFVPTVQPKTGKGQFGETNARRDTAAPADGGFSHDGLLLPGTKIDGWEGRVVSCISHNSGEAEIYVVENKKQEQFVLKYYRTGIVPKQEIVTLLAKLQHKGLVQIYRLGQHWGRFFELMTYCRGGPVSKRDKDNKSVYLPMRGQQFEQVVETLNETLHYLHTMGIIHRDIKPANILVQDMEAAELKITDFGISSLLDLQDGNTERATNVNRTEGYAAPEVYSGLTRREVDYYALGITFYVFLTDKDPFQKLNPRQVMCLTVQGKVVEHLFGTPEGSKLSPRYRTLLTGLLATANEKRWGFEEISRWLKGEDIKVEIGASTSLPEFRAGGLSINSLNQMADALLQNKKSEQWQRFLTQGDLSSWVSSFDKALGNEIKEIGLRFRAIGNPELGLQRLAFTLDQEIPYVSSNGVSASSREELARIFEKEGVRILPAVRDSFSGLQLWMESRDELKEFVAWAREWVKASGKDDEILFQGLLLSLRGLSSLKIDTDLSISSLGQLLETKLTKEQKAKIEKWIFNEGNSPLYLWLELSESSQAKQDREYLRFHREAFPKHGLDHFLETLKTHTAAQIGSWRYGGQVKRTSDDRIVPHGYGLGIHAQGIRYLGEWADGMRCGVGRSVMKDGIVFEGNYQNDSENGMGLLKKEKAWQYRGNFLNGFQHGPGILENANGDHFEGAWQRGKMSGAGRYFNPKSGAAYVGMWLNNDRHGEGFLTYKNGSWERGIWAGNKLVHGQKVKVKSAFNCYEREVLQMGRSVLKEKISFKFKGELIFSALRISVLSFVLILGGTVSVVLFFRWLSMPTLLIVSSVLLFSLLPIFLMNFAKLSRNLFGKIYDENGSLIRDWSNKDRPFVEPVVPMKNGNSRRP